MMNLNIFHLCKVIPTCAAVSERTFIQTPARLYVQYTNGKWNGNIKPGSLNMVWHLVVNQYLYPHEIK